MIGLGQLLSQDIQQIQGLRTTRPAMTFNV